LRVQLWYSCPKGPPNHPQKKQQGQRLQNHLTLNKIKKLIEAKENTKRNMAELTKAQEESYWTKNNLSNYHKEKN
jgi:hypothetical protein